MNPWLVLTLSIASEVAGTLLLKASYGLSQWAPTAGMGLCYAAAIWLMGLASKQMEIGMAYAVWAGAGTALIALLGVALFSESASWGKALGVGCIVLGVLLLHLNQAAPA
ncbi:multidrug efflux SMR transporter [Comamonas sp. GB3 AK4-5]|uniref:DMT family transporter n=1 Tax=Comamonas sp. GB3 AK4-5 TaxID=3231487 RepID=UPI00351E5158